MQGCRSFDFTSYNPGKHFGMIRILVITRLFACVFSTDTLPQNYGVFTDVESVSLYENTCDFEASIVLFGLEERQPVSMTLQLVSLRDGKVVYAHEPRLRFNFFANALKGRNKLYRRQGTLSYPKTRTTR
jgi:hypothetical protein